MTKTNKIHTTSWFYTAPIEEVAVRRGDPLGLQAVAERVAEAFAPGLSNRTLDARWISILCWCLREGQSAWKAYGDGRESVSQATGGKGLYPWIRPLELLWVARAAEVAKDGGRGRQLPGIRPIRKWIEQDKQPKHFSFAASSYEQYRFTGAYGGYRAALRALQGLTDSGAGWLPGPSGQELAEIVSAHVNGRAVYSQRPGPVPTPERFWVNAVDWKPSSADFLPTVLERPKRLNGDERSILREALFAKNGGGEWQKQSLRRLRVAEAAAGSAASTRADLMVHLATSLKNERELDWLPYLAAFSSLADAGTAAMNACWRGVSQAGDSVLTSNEVAAIPDVRKALKDLVEACARWNSDGSNSWSQRAGALSQHILTNSSNPRGTLERLIQFHSQYGGGLKWVILDGTKVRPVARLRDGDASTYRYRLPALARLAKQCGVTSSIPAVLREESEAGPIHMEGVA